MNNSKVVLRISFALAMLSAALILFAYTFGFMPDEERAELEARANIAESLAVQLIADAGNNDLVSLRQTIDEVVNRNPKVLSIAMRRDSGVVIIQAGNHDKNWIRPEDGNSTSTHIVVPILNAQAVWGTLEMVFTPLAQSSKYFGIPPTVLILVGFLATSGLIGNFIVLRRTLKAVDPSNIVPERVQNAFDTLAEGVLILDDRGTILLSNKSFTNEINQTQKTLMGLSATELPWENANSKLNSYPWELALRDGIEVVGMPLNMVKPNGDLQKFTVNATRIVDMKKRVTGVIVTFDDVTALEFKNAELSDLVARLKEKETEIKLKNNELHHLATRDPLTNCLNRRAFFETFKSGIENARKNNIPVYCMMMDLDHFKSVNDTFGHAVGDEVIVLMADILNAACRETDLAGRYGGEEFCIALFGLSQENSLKVAERIRLAIEARSKEISALDRPITTSIGMVKLSDDIEDPNDLVIRADEALYAAKTSGRNRIVDWNDMPLAEDARNMSPAVEVGTGEVETVDEQKFAADTKASRMSIVDPAQKMRSEQQFLENVSISIDRSQRNGTIVLVLYVAIETDLDLLAENADVTNQALIRNIYKKLTNLLRGYDNLSVLDEAPNAAEVSHFASDILAVQIADLTMIDSGIWIIKRLVEALKQPVNIDGQEINITCSIGACQFPADGTDAEKLLQNARSAQAYAKSNYPPNGHMFYSKKLTDYSYQQMEIDRELQEAMANNILQPQFQPIINLDTRRVNLLEIQTTLPDKKFSKFTASQLIFVAERSGTIHTLGNWLLKAALRQLSQWQGIDLAPMTIAIDITTTQLLNQKSTDQLIAQLAGSVELAPKILLNILDNSRAANRKTIISAVQELRKTGVQLEIGNLGSGSLTLDDIARLRPDYVNIDAFRFEATNPSESSDANLSAVLAMSGALNIPVIAKGVHTLQQQDKFVASGCNFAQGAIICRPMENRQLVEWLQLFVQKTRQSDPQPKAEEVKQTRDAMMAGLDF